MNSYCQYNSEIMSAEAATGGILQEKVFRKIFV